MTMNNNIDDILDELELTDREKQIFLSSIRETKLAQINNDIDAKAAIIEMIKEEFR